MQPLLLNALLPILRGWVPAFSQQRSAERAVEQALGSLLSLGRRTLSRALWALGRQHRDWGADYKLHSRANWEAQDLFQPILEQASRFCDDSVLVVAMDDTRIRKTGRKILSAFFQRDPLSPKFRFNLMWGLRFLHFSLLVPLYRSNTQAPPRSLPVRFLEVPAIKRPGKKASAAEWETYQQAVKQGNLSRRTIALLKDLRQSTDVADLRSQPLAQPCRPGDVDGVRRSAAPGRARAAPLGRPALAHDRALYRRSSGDLHRHAPGRRPRVL
jgi:hypothetical protein